VKSPSKIVVTGSTGLIGKQLCKLFGEGVIPFQGNITDADAVSRFIYSLEDVQGFIHLAALVPKQIVDQNIALAAQVNINGTINILEALRKMGTMGRKVPWFFYASTSHCYASSMTPLKETDPVDPFTLYGLSKLHGEQWAKAFAHEFKIPLCVGRIFSFSDPQQPDYYFIPAMFKKILAASEGETLRVPGVRGHRDFMRVEQICQIILQLMEKKALGVFNIGSGQSHLLSDVVLKIADVCGRKDLHFEFPEAPPNSLVADNSKLKSLDMASTDQLDLLLREMGQFFLAT
jgi:nucleoside-diphosphate-sugar epimerase